MSISVPITLYDSLNNLREFTIIINNDLSKDLLVEDYFSFSIFLNDAESQYFEAQYGDVNYILSTFTNITDILSQFILTNNKNKTLYSYEGENENLAVQLYRKKTETLIPQNIKDSTQLLFQCNEIEGGVVNISLLSGPKGGVSSKTIFEYQTIYSVHIDFNIMFGWSDERNIVTFDFVTENQTSLVINFPNAPINPIFKRKNFSDIFNGNKFNYQFSPTLNHQGKIEPPILIQENITKQFETLYISQYLDGYQNYITVLEEQASNQDLVIEIKKLLFNNHKLLHSSIQGVLVGIQNLFGLFCEAMGGYFYLVEEGEKNFTYRITSNLPKFYWTKYIKHIVHPVSWRDEYIFIDTSTILPNINIMGLIHEQSIIKSNIGQLIEYPVSYLDKNLSTTTAVPYYYEGAAVGDFETHNRINFKPSIYSTEYDYNDIELLSLLDIPSKFKVQIMNKNENMYYISMEYLLTGVALQYLFKIINKNTGNVFQELQTNDPLFFSEVPLSLLSGEFILSVTLINNDFVHTIQKEFVSENYLLTENDGSFIFEISGEELMLETDFSFLQSVCLTEDGDVMTTESGEIILEDET